MSGKRRWEEVDWEHPLTPQPELVRVFVYHGKYFRVRFHREDSDDRQFLEIEVKRQGGWPIIWCTHLWMRDEPENMFTFTCTHYSHANHTSLDLTYEQPFAGPRVEICPSTRTLPLLFLAKLYVKSRRRKLLTLLHRASFLIPVLHSIIAAYVW